MGRPIIGITGELEAARWGNWIREAVVSPVSYTRAVERAGGTPVILPPVPASSVPVLIAGLNGLVLTSGRDVDPSLYDEAPHEQTDLPDHRRDRFELILTRAAIDADLPFLAIGRGIAALPTPPRRSVILAFWDAEEDGLLGSAHYVANPLVPLVSTVTYINYDIQGANLLPSLKNFSFSVGAETGTGLPTMVQQAASGITLDLRLLSAVFGQFRSDYTNFIVSGVPTVFFSDSTGPCYHTTGDEVEIVPVGKHLERWMQDGEW